MKICYSVLSPTGSKLIGGTFDGDLKPDTIQKLVTFLGLKAKIQPSTAITFIDKKERNVSLYVHVDPSSTDEGKHAWDSYHANKCQDALTQLENERIMNTLNPDELNKVLKALKSIN